MELNRLQLKWDVYLLTQFFNNPGYKMDISAYVFRDKNNISEEEFKLLKRAPNLSFTQHRGADVYGFVSRYLTPLYNYIDYNECDITDVFDISNLLKESNIDATDRPLKTTQKYKEEAKKDTKRNTDLQKAQKSITEFTYQHAGQWHVCK